MARDDRPDLQSEYVRVAAINRRALDPRPLCPDCVTANPAWPVSVDRGNTRCAEHQKDRARWRGRAYHQRISGAEPTPYSPAPLSKPDGWQPGAAVLDPETLETLRVLSDEVDHARAELAAAVARKHTENARAARTRLNQLADHVLAVLRGFTHPPGS